MPVIHGSSSWLSLDIVGRSTDCLDIMALIYHKQDGGGIKKRWDFENDHISEDRDRFNGIPKITPRKIAALLSMLKSLFQKQMKSWLYEKGAGRFPMDFAVIEGPPDEIVPLKYIEEARPRETGERRGRITAPTLFIPARNG
jgi:hypothetical protein